MKNFTEFMKANKKKAYSIAKENARYDVNGRPVIERNDDWANDNVWDTIYKGERNDAGGEEKYNYR